MKKIKFLHFEKIILVCILTTIFIVSALSCGQKNEERESEPIPNLEERMSALEGSYNFFMGNSLEELIDAVCKARNGGTTPKEEGIKTIDEIYVPRNVAEGYELYAIRVNETRIHYYYAPTDPQKRAEFWDPHLHGYVVSVARKEDVVDASNPLSEMEKRAGIKANEDGILCNADGRGLTRACGNTYVSVYMGVENLNEYEIMKYVSEMERIVLE